MHTRIPIVAATLALGVAALTPTALAQEALLTTSATQPGKGVWTLRSQARFTLRDSAPSGVMLAEDDPGGDESRYTLRNTISYGITGDLAAVATVPIVYRQIDDGPGGDSTDSFGLGDISAGFKWRFYKHDSSAIDTFRVALVGGVEIPTYADDLSSESFNPYIGIAYTLIRGRHGLGQSASYTLMTGSDEGFDRDYSADVFRFDTAYVYRFYPAAWEADSPGGHYFTAELTSEFSVTGDQEVLLTPGYLYEGREIAAEFGVSLPVWSDVEGRRETDVGIVAGVRFLF